MAEARAVFVEAVSRALQAISRGRSAEAVRWMTDLMYYACLNGLEDQYVKLFEKVVDEVESSPVSFRTRFAESLNSHLEKIRLGPEATYLRDLVDRVEAVKKARLVKYLAPPEELVRVASKIVDEVLR
jgi:hypothetical protein